MLPSLASTRLVDDDVHACDHCGHAGPDVRAELVHIGGQDYQRAFYCDDREACWQRWEGQAGYVARQ